MRQAHVFHIPAYVDKDALSELLYILAKHHGGGNLSAPVQGFWRNESGEVEREEMLVLEVATDQPELLRSQVFMFLIMRGERFAYHVEVGSCEIVNLREHFRIHPDAVV